ncbi:response regulator transcription factor [Janibacter cremeus]|uniref:response regulator transcription factor n=1 Tax=Janibacter cremeus TaxID=1285192 RepID=UPI0023FA02DB|nr:response regulator transcription factor [Janibacter cremeus]WEV79688.1 response regulator transcription factor [Janibacter cremeus]
MTGSAAPQRLLVVEDDPTINEALTDRFEAEGFAVVRAYDGPEAVAAYEEHSPDLVVLDLMLPGFDGLEVCRRIQSERPVPVLMLTARDDESDIIVGLGVGADDYLTKPFRMREVVARVRALLRRVDRAAELHRDGADLDRTLRHHGLVLDARTRRCTVDGEPVHLTPTEFDVLVLLAREPGAVLHREHIATELWGWDDSSRTLDTHVKSLRTKVGHTRIRTVHGVGYALDDGLDR